MDSVFRAAIIYFFLLIIFRIAGKRTLAEITTFDLLLTLIISEATQQAMIDNDHSITGAIVVITTLVGIDILLSILKQRFPTLGHILDGRPVLVLRDGKILADRAKQERIDHDDILAAARRLQGLERLDQIKYAVVEESGGLSIIPVHRSQSGGNSKS
jgi:uncharacterized membrane protein YcaP (DUF421 family)